MTFIKHAGAVCKVFSRRFSILNKIPFFVLSIQFSSWKFVLNWVVPRLTNRHKTSRTQPAHCTLSLHPNQKEAVEIHNEPSLFQRNWFTLVHRRQSHFPCLCRGKLDGVGPVDNRPSTDKLHHFLEKKRIFFDMWHMTCDTWHMTYDTWHVTCDMWNVTCDMWHVVGGEHSLKISAP